MSTSATHAPAVSALAPAKLVTSCVPLLQVEAIVNACERRQHRRRPSSSSSGSARADRIVELLAGQGEGLAAAAEGQGRRPQSPQLARVIELVNAEAQALLVRQEENRRNRRRAKWVLQSFIASCSLGLSKRAGLPGTRQQHTACLAAWLTHSRDPQSVPCTETHRSLCMPLRGAAGCLNTDRLLLQLPASYSSQSHKGLAALQEKHEVM